MVNGNLPSVKIKPISLQISPRSAHLVPLHFFHQEPRTRPWAYSRRSLPVFPPSCPKVAPRTAPTAPAGFVHTKNMHLGNQRNPAPALCLTREKRNPKTMQNYAPTCNDFLNGENGIDTPSRGVPDGLSPHLGVSSHSSENEQSGFTHWNFIRLCLCDFRVSESLSFMPESQ